MLSIDHLSFSYGSSPVLSDVSFNVADGENTVILGVNGEGKTTLLRCICGVLHPLSGKICLDGKDITSAKAFERARRIAYVPQLQRISSLTVFDTVLSGRRGAYSFLPGKSDRKRTGSIMEQLGIADLAAKKTYELSGGELRKVSVARALCSDAKLILMDEPTANLDIGGAVKLIETIKDISEQNSVTFIVTMHDISLASRFSDKIILMKNGTVSATGGTEILTPEKIKEVYGIDASVHDLHGTTVAVPK